MNNAVLSKVAECHGVGADQNYPLWMDDGAGGQPATMKTPPKPFIRSDCERATAKKLEELRGN